MTVDQKAQVANAREEQQMSNENDEQNRAEVDLRTPEEWCQIERVQILDADGWRGRDGRDWTDPISQAEFQQRLATCTQRSIPLQESPITGPQYPRPQQPGGVTIGGSSGPWPAGATILATTPTTQPAGEHHTGTLDLTGEGNASEPITVTGPDADLVRALLADPHRNDHILQIDGTGWTIQHPVIERAIGELFDCHIGQEHDQLNALWDTHSTGRYVAWLTEGVIWTEPIGGAS